MPKYLLDISDINVRFQKTCSESVPEHMRCDMHIYGSKRSIFMVLVSKWVGKVIEPLNQLP